MDVSFNTAPVLVAQQRFLIPKDAESFRVGPLAFAKDLENDPLTHMIVTNPDEGVLSDCSTSLSGLTCQYVPPRNFLGTTKFSYKFNDGITDSNVSEVSLKVFTKEAFITKIESGGSHVCALFNEGNIRCWGFNGSGQLGLGHRLNVGATDFPLSQEEVDIKGGKAIDISLGEDFTCALLETNEVKCWGDNSYGQLGLGRDLSSSGTLFPLDEVIDFGTDAKIIDIESGGYHSCAILKRGGPSVGEIMILVN